MRLTAENFRKVVFLSAFFLYTLYFEKEHVIFHRSLDVKALIIKKIIMNQEMFVNYTFLVLLLSHILYIKYIIDDKRECSVMAKAA